MRRGMMIGTALAAASMSGAARAQAAADDATLRAEIAQLEARIVLLTKLKTLRDQRAALEADAPDRLGEVASVMASPPPASAPVFVPATPTAGAAAEVPQTPDEGEADTGGSFESEIGGIKFGVGLGFTYDLGDTDRVKSATVVNGIVRITESDNVRARLILESHYFFTPDGSFLGLRKGDWGIGPFVAVQGGPSDVIAGMGMGVMIGLKRLRANPASLGSASDKTEAESDGSSFNIGVGVFYDLGVQTLGDGIEANKPLPDGETEIRFNQQSQKGLMILSSFAF